MHHSHTGFWRRATYSSFVAIIALLGFSHFAHAQQDPMQVEITSAPSTIVQGSTPAALQYDAMGGLYNPQVFQEADVNIGQSVNLSADMIDLVSSQGINDSAEDFVWSSDYSSNDVCDLTAAEQSGTSCSDVSNFQATDYGVAFQVPYNAGPTITITVTSNNPLNKDTNGNPTQATIVLHNLSYAPNIQATLITSAAAYPYPTFTPYLALNGWGHWVFIDGRNFFVPNTYVMDGVDWQPYRNGYWSYDLINGWTWISYDPWGWCTDHYGVWRHHADYGWVWMPFNDGDLSHYYRPHVVTWVGFGPNVGLFMYYRDEHYAMDYSKRWGRVDRFDDGFELGFDAGRHFGEHGYNIGGIVFARGDILRPNIGERGVILAGGAQVGFFKGAYGNQQSLNNIRNAGRFPGGTQAGARAFLDPKGQAPSFSSNGHQGRAGIVAPIAAANRPTPAAYRAVADANQQAIQSNRGHMPPMGTAMKLNSTATRASDISRVAPTTNGKVIVAPPMIRDSSGKIVGAAPVQSRNPARPAAGNPIAAGHTPAAPHPVKPTPPATKLPPAHGPTPAPHQGGGQIPPHQGQGGRQGGLPPPHEDPPPPPAAKPAPVVVPQPQPERPAPVIAPPPHVDPPVFRPAPPPAPAPHENPPAGNGGGGRAAPGKPEKPK